MNLLRCSRLVVGALLAAFLGGCGGSSSNQNAPSIITIFNQSSAVFRNHSSALYVAGYNAFGQLGNNTFDNHGAFIQPAGFDKVRISGVAVGGAHTIAFTNNSTVMAWGSNSSGQIGNLSSSGSGQATKTPDFVRKSTTATDYLRNVVSVAAGSYHSLAADADGNVWAWGDNSVGQLGTKDTDKRNYAVPVLANSGSTPLGAVAHIKQVAAGGMCSFALDTDGHVWSWGYNRWGQLSNGSAINSYATTALPVLGLPAGLKVVQIAAAGSYAVARMEDNTVYAWGYDYWGQIGIDPRKPENLPLLAKDTNNNTIMAIANPTQIFRDAARTTPLYATNIVAGSDHVLAVEQGTNAVLGWGEDFYGQLGANNKTAHQTPGDQGTTLYYSTIPLQAVYGEPTADNGKGTPLTGVSEIYAYGDSSFAMLPDGTLIAWGSNVYGQLGFSDESKTGYQENARTVPGFP